MNAPFLLPADWNPPRRPTWTDQETAQLVELWAEGLDDGIIARRLNKDRTCICRKRRKLGLQSLQTKRRTKPPRERLQRQPAPRPARPTTHIAAPVLLAPEPLCLPLEQLTAFSCKWPIGDPAVEGFGFCGHAQQTDRVYCAYHCGLAYLPNEPRRDPRHAA